MRIVLHAGFHKTGTTSLQVTLDAHRAALAGFVHFETPHGTPHLSRAAEAARGFCLTGDARALAQGMRDWVVRIIFIEARLGCGLTSAPKQCKGTYFCILKTP